LALDFRTTLWQNFGAAIAMLRNAVATEEMWQEKRQFFYLSYHTAIFLDYYLSRPPRDFSPMLPYALADPERLPPGAIDDVLPLRHYRREEMEAYLLKVHEKCKSLIVNASDADFESAWIRPDEVSVHGLCPSVVEEYSLLEILFYNFRHVQHHVGQLNLLLRQELGRAPDWELRAEG
jgi:hypothetical protein